MNSGLPLDLPDSILDAMQATTVSNASTVSGTSGEDGSSALPVSEKTASPAPPAELNNKRAHHRVVVHFPYALLLKDKCGHELRMSGYTEDLSLGGVSVGASRSLPINVVVAMRIDLFVEGKCERIIAMAKCIHQSLSARLGGFRYGFQFVSLNEQSPDAIARYMRTRAPA